MPKSTHQAIAIGSSTGGIEALLTLASGLPARLPAVVLVTQHIGGYVSVLPELMRSRGPNPALHPRDGDEAEPGTIYIAPPDRHMLIEQGCIRLVRGPKENHSRPAIDPMFRSVALEFGGRAIGVVLTGFLDDGTAGLKAIKQCGGTVIVQDPVTAVEPSMPRSALANVQVDHCVPIPEMVALFRSLIAAPAADLQPEAAEQLRREQLFMHGKHSMEILAAFAAPSPFTCPDCGGGLWEVNDKKPLRFRCHTGHAFTAQTLANAQGAATEHALWSSVRALQEKEMLLRRVAVVARAQGDDSQAATCHDKANDAKSQADQLSRFIEKEDGGA